MYYILNKELEAIAEITTLISINWEEEYLSESGGDFEIVLPASGYPEIGIDDIYIIYKSDSLKFGIVNHIEYIDNFTEDEELLQKIIIKGEMGESILKQRVLSFQLNKSGTLNEIVKNVINTHFTNPKDAARQVNLKYVEDSTFSDFISKSVTGCTVAELLVSLCSSKKYSYRINLNLEQKRFYMKLIRGEDKSSNVVFCKSDDNLKDFTYIKSKENFVSHVFVGGEGDGLERKIATVSNSNLTGLDRNEVFLDKKNMSSKDMDSTSYYNKLYEEGKAELSKYSVSEASSFDIFLNNYEYDSDFTLGDKVRIKNENLGIETITRILAVLISVDENGVESKQLTLGDIAEIELKEDETSIEKEEYTSEDRDENDNIIDTTWDTKVTQISTEYIKIYAKDENDFILSDHEFAGGFFKIADDVYVMNLKNNTEKKIKQIYYLFEENILKSEDEIHGRSFEELIDCMTHTVDSEGNHRYDCELYSYCNLTKIVTVGAPLVEEIDGYELINVANLTTIKCIDARAGILFKVDRDKTGKICDANFEVKSSYDNMYIQDGGREIIGGVEMDYVFCQSNLYYIYDAYKTQYENYKNNPMTYRFYFKDNPTGDCKVYARKISKDGRKSDMMDITNDTAITATDGMTINFYLYAPKNNGYPVLNISSTKPSGAQYCYIFDSTKYDIKNLDPYMNNYENYVKYTDDKYFGFTNYMEDFSIDCNIMVPYNRYVCAIRNSDDQVALQNLETLLSGNTYTAEQKVNIVCNYFPRVREML